MNSAEEMKNFYSRCLLCTCRPDVTPHLNIFSEAGSQLQMPEKIGKYLNIQIVSELPQNVCHSCMEKLEVTHELVTSSQQARITLLQIKQQIEILDQEDTPTEVLLGCISVKDEAGQDSVKCPQPNLLDELTFHGREIDGDLTPEQQDYVATPEERKDDTEGRLTRLDMKNTVGEFETLDIPPQETKRIHQVYGSLIKCDVCSIRTKDIHSLVQHKNKKHNTNLSFDCEQCEKTFLNLNQIRIHIRKMHAVKDHVCEECGKSFTRKSFLMHLNSHCRHTSERQIHKQPSDQVQCGMCDQHARNKFVLLMHINHMHLDVVVEPLPFCCELCNKEFSNYNCLTSHLNHVHTPKLRCSHCGKLITRCRIKSHLKLHQLCKDGTVSLNNQPSNDCTFLQILECSECGDKYVHSEMLAWHTENCHGKSPTVKVLVIDGNQYHYQCIFCQTVFRLVSQVISHLRDKHQLAKLPYQCKVCNKQFIRPHNLMKHATICKQNNIYITNIRPVQVESIDSPAENIERPIEEVLISKIDIEENEINLEQEEIQLDSLPHNVDVGSPLKLAACNVLLPKLLECEMCSFCTDDKTELTTHMQVHQTPNTSDGTRFKNHPATVGWKFSRNLKCNQCGVQFVYPEMLAWHTENCHGSNAIVRVVLIGERQHHYQCVLCETVFNDVQMIIQHLTRQHSIRNLPFRCNVCKKQFTKIGNLRMHQQHSCKSISCIINASHHPQKSIEASKTSGSRTSNKEYKSEKEGKQHISNVHAIRKFCVKCLHCDTYFNSITCLKSHCDSMHHGKNIFRCEICKVDFGSYNGYWRHNRYKHGSQVFTCTICSAILSCPSSLKAHMKNLHPLLQSFTCELCSATFKCEKYLRNHFRSVHSGKILNCQHCIYYTRIRGNFVKHLKRKHHMPL
ncbi:hypothetical protein B566_EDAN006595 [Ephemera danica]|nr:hypothetical protein B566_EDAN006595 [Ephemera danica]